MTKPLLKLGSADEVETIFYEAFMHSDLDVMAALWATSKPVCIHPGAAAIMGYNAILRSWSHILGSGGMAQIQYDVINKTKTDDLVIHLVTESIQTAAPDPVLVLATNVYQRFEHGWQMLEHHASIVQAEQPQSTLQ